MFFVEEPAFWKGKTGRMTKCNSPHKLASFLLFLKFNQILANLFSLSR